MKRILIVEDEPAQAETYIAALNGAGWQVTWVQSIDAALHAAPSVDLILADRGLPEDLTIFALGSPCGAAMYAELEKRGVNVDNVMEVLAYQPQGASVLPNALATK